MRLGKYQTKSRETLFIVAGIILALIVILYLFFIIRSLAKKTNEIFGPPTFNQSGIRFDFVKFEQLLGKFPPENQATVVATSTASSTH